MKFATYLLGVSLALLVAYAAIVAWFKVEEDRFIYYPDRSPYKVPQSSLGLVPQRVSLKTADSVTLAAWVMSPPASVPADSAPWLLYCHGNSGNLGTFGYHDAWSRLRALGVGILAMDYRGYGESGGVPSEQGLYRDAEAAYAYLRNTLGVQPHRIIFYGYSLGSAVAVNLAARLKGGALIMEGAILSVPHRARELYPFLPVFALARNRFASIDKIANVPMPKLFVHSREDEVNPFAHTARLYELARPPKDILPVTGLHGSAYKTDPGFMPGIGRFLAKLGYPRPSAAAAAESGSLAH